jgi:ribonucleoside-diphosphate reductase alpha chain
MDNPNILLDQEIQRKGAKEVTETNKKIASIIGINQAARTNCIKPAGSTSCILGTASGIHPHHAKRYIRRVQANKNEFPLQWYKAINPLAVEKSVWSANGTDDVISFLCEVPKGAILKNSISAVDFLEQIKNTQNNWVEFGTNIDRCVIPSLRHNVSVTVIVKNDEWDEVENFIYDNRKSFAGISLLPASGDLDYPQAPFSTVLTPDEIVAEYGDASVFASGLVVDGLAAFDGNLWKACDTAQGRGEKIQDEIEQPLMPGNDSDLSSEEKIKNLIKFYTLKLEYDKLYLKKDWVRRAKQFAERYFSGDISKMSHCLKHVSLWKVWCDIRREHRDIDWSDVVETDEFYVDANTLGAQACSGGQCELK